MSELEDGLSRLRGVRAELENARGRRPRKLLARERLLGATFTPGDLVRDKISGEELEVVTVTFETVLVASADERAD